MARAPRDAMKIALGQSFLHHSLRNVAHFGHVVLLTHRSFWPLEVLLMLLLFLLLLLLLVGADPILTHRAD